LRFSLTPAARTLSQERAGSRLSQESAGRRKEERVSSASANTLTPFDSPSPAELDASSEEGVDGFAFSLEKGDHEVVDEVWILRFSLTPASRTLSQERAGGVC
jgi:hypothetical protein